MRAPDGIDIPNLDEALLDDGEGVLRDKIQQYLEEAKRRAKARLDQGVTQDEHAKLAVFQEGLEACTKVLHYIPAMQRARQ